mmetsp:Transcript_19696/g.40992  ORF Transcript_19696/g.40992 Transcript_19696/m.40992 type:complete len:99 (-) Transcript_19696:39-335(-)
MHCPPTALLATLIDSSRRSESAHILYTASSSDSVPDDPKDLLREYWTKNKVPLSQLTKLGSELMTRWESSAFTNSSSFGNNLLFAGSEWEDRSATLHL